MGIGLVFFEYIAWAYGEGVKEFWRAWTNAHWFVYRFFSVPLMVRTLFQPFRRMQEGYGQGFDVERWLETFVMNMITRAIGFLVRASLLLFALVVELGAFAFGAAAFILFLGAPVIIPLGLAASFILFFV